MNYICQEKYTKMLKKVDFLSTPCYLLRARGYFMDNNIIGKRILRRRQELGWTQQELAEKMGYKSKSSINKIELGIADVNYKKLAQFASVLKMNVGELVCSDNENIFDEFKDTRFSSKESEEIKTYIKFILSKRNNP